MNPMSIKNLDCVLTSLEKLVLEADVSDMPAKPREAAAVRRLLSPGAPAKSVSIKSLRTTLAARLSMLRELGTRRPELRSKLALAFREKSSPTTAEVDALIEHLTRAGDLKKTRK